MDLPLLFTQSFWRDEAFTALIAVKSPWEIILSLIKDQSPPLYFLLLHFWMQFFGTSEYMIRLLSAFWYIGLIIAVYLLAGEYIQNWLGRAVVAASIFLNPLLIQYAAEARPYMMYACLTSFGVYFLVKKKYILSGIIFGLASLTHNFGLFNIVAVFFWWIYEYRSGLKNSLWNSIKFFVPAALLSGLWVIITIVQFNRINGTFWITENSMNMFIDMLQSFTRGEIWNPNFAATYVISLIMIVVGASYFIAPQKKNLNQTATLALFLSIIPPVITYLISHFKTPIYHDRYLLASLPMIVIAVSYGVTRLWEERRVTRIGLTVLIGIFLSTIFISSSQINNTSNKPPINWAVSQVIEQARPGDIVISEDIINFLETKWYMRNNAKSLPAYTDFQGDTFPYYIGAPAFDSGDIITSLPPGKDVWVIQIDGGYHKYVPGEVLSTGKPQ
jgi:4-amino-4-deoxy-L-arabinose transferase-like glycosyltransferase